MEITRKELIGVVGVDSGQLLVTDPCYISDFQSNVPQGHEKLRDTKTQKIYTFGEDFCNFEDKIPGTNITFNKALESGRMEELPWPDDVSYSYRGCCSVTNDDKKQGGQLHYALGHAGVGVCFRSGLGDGEYEVWAHYAKCGEWGERIYKVEIILIPEEEK